MRNWKESLTMSFKLRKPSLSSGAIAGAVGVAFVVGSAGGAYAGHQIHTKEIAKHAVTWNKLAKGVQKKIHKGGPQGKPGVAGKDGADGVALGATKTFDATTITNIGGSFAGRATELTTLHLDAGQYLISSDAFFNQTDDTKTGEHPVLQLAVRGDDGSTWGTDLGTCFTGAFPGGPGDIDQSCSDSKLVTIPAGGQDVTVYGFGYNSDQSATGSGNFEVKGSVTALKVLG